MHQRVCCSEQIDLNPFMLQGKASVALRADRICNDSGRKKLQLTSIAIMKKHCLRFAVLHRIKPVCLSYFQTKERDLVCKQEEVGSPATCMKFSLVSKTLLLIYHFRVLLFASA